MRVFVICVCLLGVALAHRWEGSAGRNHGGGGRFGGGDDNRGRYDDDERGQWGGHDGGRFNGSGNRAWGDEWDGAGKDNGGRYNVSGNGTWGGHWDGPGRDRFDDDGDTWRGHGRGRFNISGNATWDSFWDAFGRDRNERPFWNRTNGGDGNSTNGDWFGRGRHIYGGRRGHNHDEADDSKRYDRREKGRPFKEKNPEDGRKDGPNRFTGSFTKDVRKRQGTFPTDDVVNTVKLTLGRAYTGISADELASAAQSEKEAAEALLAAHNADVSDEDAQSAINDVAATINGVPAVESIDSDELGDQANKVTLILQLWKGLIEKVKSQEGLGQNYDAALKALSKLSDSLLKAVKKSVDYVTVKVFKKKATNSKRQDEDAGGDWTSSANVDYNPDTGATVGAALTYSNGPWSLGGTAQYNTNKGPSGSLDAGYQGDGYQIGGNLGYSPGGGTSVGIKGTWEWK